MKEMEWTNKQKISKSGPKTLAISNKDTTSQKKLVISVKNVNAQFTFP